MLRKADNWDNKCDNLFGPRGFGFRLSSVRLLLLGKRTGNSSGQDALINMYVANGSASFDEWIMLSRSDLNGIRSSLLSRLLECSLYLSTTYISI